jgi:hypothetical protein
MQKRACAVSNCESARHVEVHQNREIGPARSHTSREPHRCFLLKKELLAHND